MPARSSFDYAILRVVPHIERGEFINVGVILFCRERAFLDARTHLDKPRLRALAPDVKPALVAEIAEHLENVKRISAGDPDAGPIAQLPQPDRFHWLASPRSTVVQVSSVHSGLCEDPTNELDHLFETVVAMPKNRKD